ncbi:hypothetical protein [Actinomadura sp. BRA 177]|uniref:hypothetical protein n=1 Tax=Actinomadura sp. BRA 177 TaxID=2745202 RepID=UPI0015959650|nr:hypothetical protein [Actinomadura sp. BRA 177]NVI88982.1 hypothetical protein [Actinomadura sp. BRA 177]
MDGEIGAGSVRLAAEQLFGLSLGKLLRKGGQTPLADAEKRSPRNVKDADDR